MGCTSCTVNWVLFASFIYTIIHGYTSSQIKVITE